jgi:hypothetical protein
MTSCDDFIEKAKRTLPELCTTKDLVKFGIYKSEQAAHNARKKGVAADYFKMPHGNLVYPKKGVIELLEKSKHSTEDENHEDSHSRKSNPQSKSSDRKGIRL